MNRENEGQDYNDIESLAAYLHSGKMSSGEGRKDTSSDVLFTPGSRRRKKGTSAVIDRTASIEHGLRAAISEDDLRDLDGTVSIGKIKPEPEDSGPEPDYDDVPLRRQAREKREEENKSLNEKRSVRKKKESSQKKPEETKAPDREEPREKPSSQVMSLSELLGEAPSAASAPPTKAYVGAHDAVPEPASEEKPELPEEKAPVQEAAPQPQNEENAMLPVSRRKKKSRVSRTQTKTISSIHEQPQVPAEELPVQEDASDADGTEDEDVVTEDERRALSEMSLRYDKNKLRMRTVSYLLIGIVLCAVILGAAAYASNYIVKWALDFSGIGSADFKVDVVIPDNADIETVAAILADNNIISDAKFFKAFTDFYDDLKKKEKEKKGELYNTYFIGGKYTVSSTMSYSTLLSILRSSVREKKTVSVRITEGMTAHEIGKILEENNVCFAEDFEKYYRNIQNIYDFERRVKESSKKFCQLEGYLFPDTYEFYIVNEMENGGKPQKDQTVQEALDIMKKASEENAKEAAKKMYSNFNEKITPRMYKKMGEMHLTLDETITLASLVQKEAASEDDMGNVASVFLNRIRNSDTFPYLQSDVTVLYAEKDIKPYFTGNSAALTKLCNEYNTYVCTGIPAGPICNPGLAAINAVLYAPETSYFYFCANPETGEVFYAQTKEEHEANLVLAGLTGSGQSAGGETIEGE